jgi:hypothetical protein
VHGTTGVKWWNACFVDVYGALCKTVYVEVIAVADKTKVRAVVCGGCGTPITVTRSDTADWCKNDLCPAPESVGKLWMLDAWETERAVRQGQQAVA